MYKESSHYPDLITESKHILHSEFIRSFIAAVGILEYIGNTHGINAEFSTQSYVPNTADQPWRPWHHIYSMCKAGKGQKHNPQVNQSGNAYSFQLWVHEILSYAACIC